MQERRLIFLTILFAALAGCDDSEGQGPGSGPNAGNGSRLDAGFMFGAADSGKNAVPDGGPSSQTDAGQGSQNADSGQGAGGSDGGQMSGPAQIVINEIMYDPRAVSDTNGEWVELTNIGPDSVDLQGWIIKDSWNNTHTISRSVVIAPSGYVVLGSAATMNGGYSADYVYDNFLLKNSGEDAVILQNAQGVTIDSLTYSTVAPWPEKMSGYSIELSRPSLNNADPSSWQLATQSFGDGDHGTPGLPNGGGNQSNSMIDSSIEDWHQNTLRASLYFAPNDPLQSIVLRHLESAQTSIRMAFFNVRLNQVLTVLTQKRNAGVDVHVILDKKQQDLFYNDMGERMTMAGIRVSLVERTEAMDSTMHNKFTIIDGHTIMTGSANYSHTAFNISDEDMMVMRNLDLASRYQTEFDELLAGGDAVSAAYPQNTALRAWMGPEDDLHDKVIDLLNSAQNQILIAMFQLNTSVLIDAIIAAKNRGVNVIVMLDQRQANQADALADEMLQTAGVSVIIADAMGSSFAEMHSKFLTVDHSRMIIGSFNWTNLGAFFNDENIVEVDDAQLVARAEGKFASMLNQYTTMPASDFGLLTGVQAVSFEVSNVTLGASDKLFIKSIGGGPFDPAVEMSQTSLVAMLEAGTSFEYVYEIRSGATVLAREVGNHAFTLPYAPGPFLVSNAFLQ